MVTLLPGRENRRKQETGQLHLYDTYNNGNTGTNTYVFRYFPFVRNSTKPADAKIAPAIRPMGTNAIGFEKSGVVARRKRH